MNDNEILFRPKVEGSVTVKAGTKFEMNFSCPEDEQNSEANNIIAEKDKEFIQNLKCCGNCINYRCEDLDKDINVGWSFCGVRNERAIYPNEVCSSWKYDDAINSDRFIGD